VSKAALDSLLSTELPSVGEYDVIVCGAGPAGLGAAIAAARGGAKVLLVERAFYVGGMSTATGINCWCDTPGGAIFDELEARVGKLGKASRRFDPQGYLWEKGRVTLHGETVKAVALKMVLEAGAEVLFGTVAARALVDSGSVRSVVLANKGGLSLACLRVVIDCTADADVAASAGARFLKGDPEDGRLMHVNFMFSLGGVDLEKAQREALPDERVVGLLREAHRRGELHAPHGAFRPRPEVFPYHPPEGCLILNYWEIEGVDASDPLAVSATVAECQVIALEVVEFCRGNLPGYEKCEISRFWDVLGTRESRRVVGLYELTREDVLAGRKFEDGVARACFFIDFHDSPPGRSIPYDLAFKRRNSPPPGDWYEIPYRCLVPESVQGMLVAGRCISADRSALASLRVMPTCMFTGQAAGTAAALAVAAGLKPHEVDAREVRARLLAD